MLVLSPMQIHACFLFFWEGRPRLSPRDLLAFSSWLWHTEANARRSQDRDINGFFWVVKIHGIAKVHLPVGHARSLPGNTKPYSADIFVKCKEGQGQEMKTSGMINSASLLITEKRNRANPWDPHKQMSVEIRGRRCWHSNPQKGFVPTLLPTDRRKHTASTGGGNTWLTCRQRALLRTVPSTDGPIR